MYTSKSKLLSQVTVQAAAAGSSRIATLASQFDELHATTDANPHSPLPVKLEKAQTKQRLMRALDDARIVYCS
jgi:hypothetical protein